MQPEVTPTEARSGVVTVASWSSSSYRSWAPLAEWDWLGTCSASRLRA